MKTVAVTGGTGFVGTYLCRELKSRGYNVRIITRKKPARMLPDAEYAVADYTDSDSMQHAFSGADYVVHLAAALFCISKREFFKTNGDGTANVVAGAKRAGIKKLIYVSSLAAGGPAIDGPRKETQVDTPTSYYGMSKREGEKFVKAFGNPFVILRPPIIYGDSESGFSKIAEWVNRGLMVNAGSEKGKFSFIYVKDLVRAIMDCVETDKFNEKVFYVGEKKNYAWKNFINMLAEGMGKKPPVMIKMPKQVVYAAGWACELFSIFTGKTPVLNRDKAREAAESDWTCDSTLWEQTAGWSDWTGLEEGIKKTFGK